MHKSIFTYTVTRSFPYPWLPWVVFVGGVCMTAIFTTLNLAANGYELYNVYVADPNATISSSKNAWFNKKPWSWATKISSVCQAQTLSRGALIYTNNHVFQYAVGHLWTQNGNVTIPVYSVSYHNDYLRECSIPTLSLQSNSTSMLILESHSTCTIYNGSTPINFELIMSYDADAHPDPLDLHGPTPFSSLHSSASIQLGRMIIQFYLDILAELSAWFVDCEWSIASSSFNNIETTKLKSRKPLVNTQRDLNNATGQQIQVFSCNASFDGLTTVIPVDPVVWASTFGADMITNKLVCAMHGNATDEVFCSYNSSDPHVINTVFVDGLAKASMSLLLTDLGQSSPVNIFASSEQTQKFINRSVHFDPKQANYMPLFAWGDFAGPQYNGLPLVDYVPPPSDMNAFYQWMNLSPPQVQPITIDAQYLCQISRLKSAGSLFFSVVVADFVFLQIIWTIFAWTTAYFLERQHPDARYCVGCAKAVALGQLDLDMDVEKPLKSKRRGNDCTSSTSREAPEQTLTWSDSISVRRNMLGDDILESTDTPLVWSNSVTTEPDPTSLRSATADSTRRRNERAPYTLLAHS